MAAVPGDALIPAPSAPAVTAADGVAISGGVASPVLASPTSVEVSSGELRAKLKTSDANGLTRGADGVALVLADQALSVGGSGVTLDRSWRVVDLSAPAAVHNVSGMAYSVTSLGSGVYRISATGTGAALDGPSDGMLQLRYDLTDAAGNVVDYAGGKYMFEWRLTLSSVTAGESLLIMPGLRTKPTTADQGVVRLAGISTGTSAIDLSTCGALASNSTTAKTGLAAVCGRLCPPPIESGSFDIGTITVTSLDSAGARIGPPSDTATTSDSSPGTCDELHVCVGFDTAHTNTKTADVKLEIRVTQVAP